MLLTGYSLEIFKSKCQSEAKGVHCFAHLDDDVREVLPFLNTVLGGFVYTKEPPSLMLKNYGKLITIHPQKIAVNALSDREEAEKIIAWLQREINETWENINGKQATVKNHYNAFNFKISKTQSSSYGYEIEFRVYDDGFAYRYIFPTEAIQDSIKIDKELNYFKKYWKTETTAVEDVPLIRLAEMYFIVTENGNTELFRNYRVARGLDILIDTALTETGEGMSLKEKIMMRREKEYRKDSYGEGQMFFFYKMRKI